MPIEPHLHRCIGYCPPGDPTEADLTGPARLEVADQITIGCAARATDAPTDSERRTWWAAAMLARRTGLGDASVVA